MKCPYKKGDIIHHLTIDWVVIKPNSDLSGANADRMVISPLIGDSWFKAGREYCTHWKSPDVKLVSSPQTRKIPWL